MEYVMRSVAFSLLFFLCTYTGLNVDGLYRVSGNLAVIQKLRFAVNHGMDCVYYKCVVSRFM